MRTIFEFETLAAIQEMMEEQTDEIINRTGGKMDETGEGEIIVGTLHDRDASRLYCAMRKMKAQSEALVASIPLAEDDEAERELHVKADRLKDLAYLAKTIFWAQVQEQMGLWNKSVGIRKNWTVVTTESTPVSLTASKLENILRKMGGTLLGGAID